MKLAIIRPVKLDQPRTFLGGESFIVSLTLALGHSKMAGREVRVDFTFLDGDFGILDREALESALEALFGLHQDGQLIGIIYHVPVLEGRTSAQMNIMPVTGGLSTRSGQAARRSVKEKSECNEAVD